MGNKYYDGQEKNQSPVEKRQTKKSVWKKVVDGVGGVAGVAFVVLSAILFKKE